MNAEVSQTTIDDFYKAQKKYINNSLSQKSISGYKAAVSSFEGQQKMGLSMPITGVLYAEGEITNNSTIQLKEFSSPKIETEIGFILNSDIVNKVGLDSIKNYTDVVLPVFEIPDIISTSPNSINIQEIISNNGFSSHYVIGNHIKINGIDINNCVANLYHNDELLNTGKATDAMDNQWLTLCKTINLSIDHGYSPKSGDLIITGALGTIFALKKGKYEANYGFLGKLFLTVE